MKLFIEYKKEYNLNKLLFVNYLYYKYITKYYNYLFYIVKWQES